MWQQKMERQQEQGRLQQEVTRKQAPRHTGGKEEFVTGDKKKTRATWATAENSPKKKKKGEGRSLSEKERVLKSSEEVL